MSKYAQNRTIIHLDIDKAELTKNVNTHINICGDASNVLKSLVEAVRERKNPEWWERIAQFEDVLPEIMPQRIIETVSQNVPEETVVATDVGQHQMWVCQYYPFKKPRTLLTSGGLGTMGFGLGAAIGGCMASGKKPTILFTGDGSFGMNLNELATAVTYNLPVTIILFNNGVLGMVRQWQTIFCEGRYSQTTLGRKTDFVTLAESFGAKGLRVNNLEELQEALNNLSTEGPTVIECMIDKDERVLPMIPPGGTVDQMIIK